MMGKKSDVKYLRTQECESRGYGISGNRDFFLRHNEGKYAFKTFSLPAAPCPQEGHEVSPQARELKVALADGARGSGGPVVIIPEVGCGPGAKVTRPTPRAGGVGW